MFSQPLNLHMCCFRVESLKTKCFFSLEKFYEEELMPLFVVYSISMLIQHCHSGGGLGGVGVGGQLIFYLRLKPTHITQCPQTRLLNFPVTSHIYHMNNILLSQSTT